MCFAQISFEFGETRHPVLEQVKLPRRDEIEENLFRQPAVADRGRQGFRHRMAAARAALQRVPPPLEPDHADVRIAHLTADAGDLGVEGIERQEMRALLIGGQ